MLKVTISDEFIRRFLTTGSPIPACKCIQGLPEGTSLFAATVENRFGVHRRELVLLFAEPGEEPEAKHALVQFEQQSTPPNDEDKT